MTSLPRQVRVFTFSVGQHNYDVTPLQWMACTNKGTSLALATGASARYGLPRLSIHMSSCLLTHCLSVLPYTPFVRCFVYSVDCLACPSDKVSFCPSGCMSTVRLSPAYICLLINPSLCALRTLMLLTSSNEAPSPTPSLLTTPTSAASLDPYHPSSPMALVTEPGQWQGA